MLPGLFSLVETASNTLRTNALCWKIQPRFPRVSDYIIISLRCRALWAHRSVPSLCTFSALPQSLAQDYLEAAFVEIPTKVAATYQTVLVGSSEFTRFYHRTSPHGRPSESNSRPDKAPESFLHA
jgi:hypothetical protein